MPKTEIHIHLAEDTSGPVHVFVHGPEGEQGSGTTEEATTVTEDVTAMLSRFETFDPTTNAREVALRMLGTGWTAFTAKPRTGKDKSEAAYLRLVYVGAKRRAVAYMNTAALLASGRDEQKVLAAVPDAVERSRDVYVYHSGPDGSVQRVLDAAEALRNWADGK